MEVALFPLAALLLLLSGVSVRRCAEVPSDDHSLLLRQLLGSHGPKAQTREVVYHGIRRPNRAGPQVRSSPGFNQEFGLAGYGNLQNAGVLGMRVAVPERLARRRYRTRFGFISGAYLAMGPPLFRTRIA